MTDSTAVVVTDSVALGVISANTPAQLVARATEAADALAGVIASKNLFSNIQGRRYVKCEGWTTLAAMMGCLPREVSCTEREDGSYEAIVALVRMSDAVVLTQASAECGRGEPMWQGRAPYARRSMAVTRATSKACRIAFSWVMTLAGYEVTPSEEMPPEEPRQRVTRHEPTEKRAVQTQPLTEKPLVLQQSEPDDLPPGTRVVTWPFAKNEHGALKHGVGIDGTTPPEDLKWGIQFIDLYMASPRFKTLAEKKGIGAVNELHAIQAHLENLLDATRGAA